LETNGLAPTPRYAHSMNFYEDGNYVIIHGGRNDFSSTNFALQDTYLLELSRFDWIKVNLIFDNRDSHVFLRCGHASIVYSKLKFNINIFLANKLLIFGGMNNQNYLGSSLFIVDLDSHLTVHKFKELISSDPDDFKFDYNIFKSISEKNTNNKNNNNDQMEPQPRRRISRSNDNKFLPPIK
jgi:hypothetical protein